MNNQTKYADIMMKKLANESFKEKSAYKDSNKKVVSFNKT